MRIIKHLYPKIDFKNNKTKIEKKLEIMIDEDIILELSDMLTELTYSLNKPDSEEVFELFILLKNLYDSIGYYSYDDLEPKDVWGFSFKTTLRLQEMTSFKETRIEERTKKMNMKLQQYLDGVHGHKSLMVIPEWPKPFVEKDRMERDFKIMIWRFGCCLAINLRAGAIKTHKLIHFLLRFLDFLNKGLYGPQGISLIEEKLLEYENEFKNISEDIGNVGYPYDIVKKEFTFTVNKLKRILAIPLPKVKKFCIECGKKLPEGVKFCIECGHKL